MIKKTRTNIPQIAKKKALLQKEINSVCPFCGNADIEHFELHHIDEDPSNNEIANLLLLCPNCHSKITKNDISIMEVYKKKLSLLTTPKTKQNQVEHIDFNGKIGSTIVGDNNTVSIKRVKTFVKRQSDNDIPKYISYTVDEHSIKKHFGNSVNRRAKISLVSLAIFLFIRIFLSSHPKFYQLILYVIPIIFAIFNFKYAFMYLGSLTNKEGALGRFFNFRFFKEIDGIYHEYTKSAKCIYPGCCGRVTIGRAPQNERQRFSAVGYCTEAETLHTYSICSNYKIGYPVELDFKQNR